MRERGLRPMYVCVCDIESMCSMRGCMCGVVRLWLGWSCEGEWVACVDGFCWVRNRVVCVCVCERENWWCKCGCMCGDVRLWL